MDSALSESPAATRVTLAVSAVPLVSVVMPVYGQGPLAIAALASIAAHTTEPYEVVLVDNASPDGAGDEIEAAVQGLHLIRSPLNVGYGAAIDLGALHARGEFVLACNSDVLVEPGWLPPLVELLRRHRSIAAVSPVLLNFDGTLQEIGSALLDSGHTLPITVDAPEERQRWRTVPYASGACLLMRRSVFCEIGGFDTVYPRGYFEDVELALDLRARGLFVACEPRSRVRHRRSASTTVERAHELWRFNSRIFSERWAPTLAALAPLGLPSTDSVRLRDAGSFDRILVMIDRLPRADAGPDDHLAVRMAERMATSNPAGVVTLLALDGLGSEEHARRLARNGVEVAECAAVGIDRWMVPRRAHYSAVLDATTPRRDDARAAADRWQPQAVRVAVEAGAVTGALAHADWADVAVGSPDDGDAFDRAVDRLMTGLGATALGWPADA